MVRSEKFQAWHRIECARLQGKFAQIDKEIDSINQEIRQLETDIVRIKTYNFKEGRVTDHRIGQTSHDLDDYLKGKKI